MDQIFNQVLPFLLAVWWPFCRILAMLSASPVVGDAMVPTPVRVLLSLVLAILMLPVMQASGASQELLKIDPFSLHAIVATLEQAVVGFVLGLAFHFAMSVMSVLGYLISSQAGFSMAVMNDPLNGTSSDVVSGLLTIMCMIVFFAVDGHLVLLDIMLPGKDGMTLCRDLRGQWQGPIVLLTSLDSDMNHILSLEMGANDYILKTTPPAVLLARLRLHLRQNPSSNNNAATTLSSLTPHKALRFGALSIDPVNRQVLLSGENIALSTADFDLLWELATHAGQIMDRDALLKNLRGVSYDGMDRSVDVAISRLRKKLLDNATEPYRIKTVRNKGYLFAPHAWDN